MSPLKNLVVAVDVDEVCAQLSLEVLKRYNRDYDDSLTPDDLTSWGYSDHVKPVCGKKVYKYFSEPGIYDSILPYDGALAGVEFLRRNGHRVIFVTSCPRGSVDMKLEWLCRHEFLPSHLRVQKDFYAASDKSLIAADVLVDDAPHNLKTFPKWKVLVSRPHNLKADPKFPHWRVSDLMQAAQRIDSVLGRMIRTA